MSDRIILETLETECIIGIFDWERVNRQRVTVDLSLECDIRSAAHSDDIKDAVDYKSLSKDIITFVEASGYKLIETLAEQIARICLARGGVKKATVRVSKPGAVRSSKNVSIEITRPVAAGGVKVYFGIGANLEPDKNIEKALGLLRSRFNVTAVSSRYRSPAWGVKEPQPDYINLAVAAETGRDLFATRAELKLIEELCGRARNGDKFAPRSMDIDLIMYGDTIVNEPAVVIPHPHLLTQQFVYYPMMDIAPDAVVPGAGKPLREITPAYAQAELPIVPVS
ncbi:MAG: 2-amino-4-hydroxy-6-hydroxymethyldihydropteridine diphosphokinase [Nitrospinae bacterium]|nr:2-amino-4-hydroxy-6-hydroxymethyldihydropteridine diphosphokinase [Nitrospinota bacterium]